MRPQPETLHYDMGTVPALSEQYSSGLEGTIDESLFFWIRNELQTGLAAAVVQPDFEAGSVQGLLSDYIAEPDVRTRIIGRQLRHEKANRKLEPSRLTKRLTETLGRMGIKHTKPADASVMLGEHTVAQLQEQLRELPQDYFAELDDYHQVWRESGALQLLSAVHSLTAESDADTNDASSDRLYDFMADVTQTNAFQLPIDQPESLMLLCYTPHETRKVVREYMRNSFILGFVERKLAEIPADLKDERNGQFFDALRRYLRANEFQSEYWAERSLSEERRLAVAASSIAALNALGDMQAIIQHKNKGGQQVITAYGQAQEELKRVMIGVDARTRLQWWQTTDYGHMLGLQEGSRSLQRVFELEQNTQEFARPKKNGRFAAVFEDEREQAALWGELVDAYTPYTMRGDSASDKVADILRLADEGPESVGLFLLDIQNGDDITAGVRLAEEIIKRRLQYAQELTERNVAEIPGTEIVVWSASAAAVKAARKHIKKVIKGYLADRPGMDRLLRYDENGLTGNGGAVKCTVRVKGWKSSDVLVIRRPSPQDQEGRV